MAVPILTSLLALAPPVFALLLWRDGRLSPIGRLGYTLFGLGALAFAPFLSYWNLLGFNW